MTYAESAATYSDPSWRMAANMCVREQGQIIAGAADRPAADRELGAATTGGDGLAIDAVLAAMASLAGATLDTDQGLLSACQTVWPAVAAARYSQAAP
jgi:hypothetical protein